MKVTIECITAKGVLRSKKFRAKSVKVAFRIASRKGFLPKNLINSSINIFCV
jgi:hypothetical protein